MTPVGYVQARYPIQLTTPLGPDALLVQDMDGAESISGLYTFHLRLVSETSTLAFDDIVGKDACVTIAKAGGDPSHVHGIVSRFRQAGTSGHFTTYYAELSPRLWLLTQTIDSRIFQNKSVPDIVKAILAEHEITDIKDALTGSYTAREYCVQYQETAFDFVSRLMESEGILYWFTHTADAHTLVLGDDGSAYEAVTALSVSQVGSPWERTDAVADCSIEARVTPTRFETDDYNFETPATDLLGVASGDASTPSVYEYPAGYTSKDAVESAATRRLEALEVPRKVFTGSSNRPDLRPGCTFDVADHPRSDVNATYVAWKVSHQGTQDGYSNTVEAFPSDTPFRPPRATPAPRIHGCQTATVVGKSGEEITTDQYGRIKVKFHWDRAEAADETSSCWVRVSQAWAGSQFGAFFLPRIGQEVVISFLEGDPDRPLVTGSVYNASRQVPYALPDNQTRTTVKTESSKGGGGFNEIRFEDKKDSEELYVHAQKDMNLTVLNDQTSTIKQNRTVTIEEADDTLKVSKGKRAVEVAGDETHTNKAKLTYDITSDLAITVGGNVTLKITGDLTLQVTGKVTMTATGAIASESSQDITVKAAMNLNQEGMAVTTKSSATHNVEAGAVLVIKGALVKIN